MPYDLKNLTSDYPYKSDCSNYEFVLHPGDYFFEAWGASGGNRADGTKIGGKGGYTSGYISFQKQVKLIALIGGKGNDNVFGTVNVNGGCGGGGNGGRAYLDNRETGAGGGGATTIFFESVNIEHRIMVSGGGGGATKFNNGANAGGLQGDDSEDSIGGGQTYGYQKGIGQAGRDAIEAGSGGEEGGGGAGAGYYGGKTSQRYGPATVVAGSGGSSYISGYDGCAKNNLAIFSRAAMIPGGGYMKLPNGAKLSGNTGNGHLRIRYIPPAYSACEYIFVSIRKIYKYIPFVNIIHT